MISGDPGPLQVSKAVCDADTADILVPEPCAVPNGLVGTVNVPVYTATPITTRRLLIYPVYFGSEPTPEPIANGEAVPPSKDMVEIFPVMFETPSTNIVNVAPFLTIAT